MERVGVGQRGLGALPVWTKTFTVGTATAFPFFLFALRRTDRECVSSLIEEEDWCQYSG